MWSHLPSTWCKELYPVYVLTNKCNEIFLQHMKSIVGHWFAVKISWQCVEVHSSIIGHIQCQQIKFIFYRFSKEKVCFDYKLQYIVANWPTDVISKDWREYIGAISVNSSANNAYLSVNTNLTFFMIKFFFTLNDLPSSKVNFWMHVKKKILHFSFSSSLFPNDLFV